MIWILSPMILKAAEWTIFGCFWTNGQICSATSRLIVHVSLLDRSSSFHNTCDFL